MEPSNPTPIYSFQKNENLVRQKYVHECLYKIYSQSPNRKQFMCQLMGKQVKNKTCFTHRMDNYSAIKINEPLIHATACVNLKPYTE